MVARLYMDTEGYMAFETDKYFLKFLVPKQLVSINKIKTYDDGYMIIDTNYGEEYIDLKSIADEIGIDVSFEGIDPVLGRAVA